MKKRLIEKCCFLACCVALNSAMAATVAVYRNPAAIASDMRSRSDEIAAVLNAMDGVKAVVTGSIDAAALKNVDALVLPNEGGSAQALKANHAFLRQWVLDGHGLLTTHDAVGYRSHVALFPEIAVGSGNFYTTQQAYKNEFCIVAEEAVVTDKMALKQRHATAYYDLITLSPGPTGKVVARAVSESGKGLFAGAPAVVVGQAGKGRYAACGLLPGGLAPQAVPVAPKDGEKQLLINLVRFLLGQGDYNAISEELGPNVYLCAAPEKEAPWAQKLPGLSVKQILAACELPVDKPDWKDTLSVKPYVLNDVKDGTPVIDKKLLDFYTTVEPYEPAPKSWNSVLIDKWKIIDVPDATNNPVNDAGTAGGYWKADADESAWTNDPPTRMRSRVSCVRWYRAHVNIPSAESGKRHVLRFDGANHSAEVFVNGKKIGAHHGAGFPFELDISSAVKPGAENVVAVRSYGGIYERAFIHTRPDVYAERVLIDPKTDASGIKIVASIVNASGKPKELELSADITPYQRMAPWVQGKRVPTALSLGKVRAEPGKSEHRFTIPLKDPQYWTPENPFLYVFNLRAGKDDLAQERFGYRTFTQEGRFFYLNGKRIYLRGAVAASCIIFRGPRHEFIRNDGRLMQRTLLAYKAMNYNNLNPQEIGDTLPREFFDNCDEIGVLLYDLNPYAEQPYEVSPENTMLMARYDDSKGAPEDLKLNPDYLPNIERYFLRNYNHPCYVMFAVSTEQRYPVYRKALKAAYDLVKKIDGQNRPICPCSGDHPALTAFEFSDVSDIHVYPGDINGHPWDHKQLLYDYNEMTWEYIGKDIPVVNYEAGGHFHLLWPEEFAPVRKLWTNETPDKAAIILNLQGTDADYHMPLNARWLTMYGIRRFVVDDYNRAKEEGRTVPAYRQEYMLRNQIGSSRLAGDLFQGFGINYARMYTTFALPADAKDYNQKFEFSNLKFTWPVDLFKDYPFLAANGFNAMRRYCNPKLIMPDLLSAKHVFAGKSFKTTLYAMNDTGDDSGEQSVRVIMYDARDNRRLLDKNAVIGTVPAAKRKLVPFEWAIPADMPTATVRLELFLVEAGAVVSDSYCDFHVLGHSEFAGSIPVNGKRVAVYDSAAENGDPGRSIVPVMDSLKIRYTKLSDFSGLNNFDVLIIGAASADNKVYKADAAIAEWLKKGGRMIQFEQGQPGAVAGVSKLNIVRKMGGSVVDMVIPAHPVFEGLRVNDYWNLWNGNLPEAQGYGREGGLYTCLIGPLNETVVGTGLMDVPRANAKAVQMAIADVKVGKGAALVSQVEAVMRYGNDSVATRYIQNALRYILSEETAFSTPISDFSINPLEFYNFGFVDMKPLANHDRVFQKDWLDLVEGGLNDLGQIRFRPAKGKVVRLAEGANRVTVKLPENMPLMFPDREKEKVIKDVDQGTLNRAVFDALYVLHAVSGAGAGQTAGEYTIRYKDGTMLAFPVVVGRNIGLDGAQDGLEDGKYIGSGMYVTRLVNPAQDKEVDTIEFKAAPGCELFIAGVTASLARLKIHD